ncbi:MAG: 4-(cytidine 5'-diphospho)-2-C-methyl-D-erythritol kinase [bacterium]
MEAARPTRSLVLSANAKVNLFLRVRGLRADGYHEIETVYHSISLADTLTVTEQCGRISVTSDGAAVPLDRSNLAVRAAAALMEPAGAPVAEGPGARGGSGPRRSGVRIHIAKRIPIGAGLGGGSADAAAALVGVNRLLGLGRSGAQLEALAEGLGADVKFMLRGGCAVGRGKGSDLQPAACLPALPVVVAAPQVTISTAWAYQALKIRLTTRESQLTMVTSALEKGDVAAVCGLLQNDFERLVFDEFPVVRSLKDALIGCGAIGALMSGSGSSVYGVFLEEGAAMAAAERLAGLGCEVGLAAFAVRGVTTPR